MKAPALAIWAVTLLSAPPASSQESPEFRCAYGAPNEGRFVQSTRWTRTALTPTTDLGEPITLTYGFVPDGTRVEGGSESSLFAVLDGMFPDQRTWQTVIAKALASWSAHAGITFFHEEHDTSQPLGSVAGRWGRVADIRIGMGAIGAGTLGTAGPPPDGDILLSRDGNWSLDTPEDPGRFLILYNVVAHEMGHALGLEHTGPRDGTKLMEIALSRGFVGPQDDDVRGAVFLYGDPFDAWPNVGTGPTLAPPQRLHVVSGRALARPGERDEIRFRTIRDAIVSVRLEPIGSRYELQRGSVRDIAIVDDFVLATTDDGFLQSFDVSDPTAPINVAMVDLGQPCDGIAVSGDHVFVALDGNPANGPIGLVSVNVSDPSSPDPEKMAEAPFGLNRVVISGTHAFATSLDDGLYVYDISDPRIPIEIARVRNGRSFRDVDVEGKIAVVADGPSGVLVFNVSTPAAPREVGRLSLPFTFSVALDGTHVYAYDRDRGLVTAGVTNPATPLFRSELPIRGIVTHIDVRNGRAALAIGQLGVDFVDVSDPASPRLDGSVTPPGVALSARFAGDRVLVAAASAGLQIVEPGLADPVIGGTQYIDTDRIRDLALSVRRSQVVVGSADDTGIGEAEEVGFVTQGGREYIVEVRAGSREGVQRYRVQIDTKSAVVPTARSNAGPFSIVVPRSGFVELEVYDVSGRLLLQEPLGTYALGERLAPTWDGLRTERLAGGVYFMRITGAGWSRSARAVRFH